MGGTESLSVGSDAPSVSSRDRLVAAVTIFLGAFLLFAVEPLIAKMILPWFGGSAGVWLGCLVFFQGALLAGYAYGHFLSGHFAPRRQWQIHSGLLFISLFFLPIIPSPHWKPVGSGAPLPLIFALLTVTVGLPFLLLAATGPLMQSWLSRRNESEDVPSIYRLYALSNLGSLLALVLYPILIEPWLTTHMQAWSWSITYILFVALSAVTAWRYRDAAAPKADATIAPERTASPLARLMWFLLAAVPSALLLAVTGHILRNVAAIPLLWVVPLALYLLSFIICFDSARWYNRLLWYGALPAAVGVFIVSIAAPVLFSNFAAELGVQAAAFFVCCMVCHGELADMKPSPRQLTSFYLTIAAAGAGGGLSIAVLAPAILSRDYDLAITLLLFTSAIGFVALLRLPQNTPSWIRWNGAFILLGTWPLVFAIVGGPLRNAGSEPLFAARNFYGPLRVSLAPAIGTRGAYIQLQNGNITHGREFTAPGLQCEPLSYYAPSSGIGAAMQAIDGPRNIGVIGLGAGTIAGYARPGDVFRFYELNPLVRQVAIEMFHYLNCAEHWNIVLGDARLSLEREAPNGFDILAVDAFTSDAIPVHLLTEEAFDLYWRNIKDTGVLAVHVSNTYVDLAPIVVLAAAKSGMSARMISDKADLDKGISGSVWVLVARHEAFFAGPAMIRAQRIAPANRARAWTDDYSNIWTALKW